MPARGLSGFIDSGPGKGHASGGSSVYEKYGYPPPYSTYDLGCGGEARDPWAGFDTWSANQITGAATVLVALANALHRMVSPPTGFLAPLDPLIDKGRKALQDALYTPYIDLSLIVLAIVLLLASRRQDLPGVVRGSGWALVVITIVAGIGIYTQQAAHVSDGFTTATVGFINQQMLGEDPNTSADPAAIRGALLTDTVLYRQWLRGEFGNSDSPVATKYGMPLLDSLAFTYAEDADTADDTHKREDLSNAKGREFTDIANKVKDEDPAAYRMLQGKSGQRLGAAWVAFLAALFTVLFLIVADILVLASLVIIRLAVTFFPALGVIGLHERNSEVVKGTGESVFAAVINSIVFAAGAALNALAVKVLLTGVPLGADMPKRLMLCGLVTLLLWLILKPFRRLTHMVNPRSPIQSGAAGMRGAGRSLRSGLGKLAGAAIVGATAGGAAAAGAASGAAATDEDDDETTGDDREPDTYSSSSQRPESQSRPPIEVEAGPNHYNSTHGKPASDDGATADQLDDQWRPESVRDGAPGWKSYAGSLGDDQPTSGDAVPDQNDDFERYSRSMGRPVGAQPHRSTPTLDPDGHSVHQIWDPDTKQNVEADTQ